MSGEPVYIERELLFFSLTFKDQYYSFNDSVDFILTKTSGMN